jgi:hypothetical protein
MFLKNVVGCEGALFPKTAGNGQNKVLLFRGERLWQRGPNRFRQNPFNRS